MRRGLRILGVLAGAFALILASSTSVGAHTETDVVAVPANERAEVTINVPHGCGAAGTTELTVQVPGTDGNGQDVAGWTVTTEPGPNDTTAVIWSGGLLPTDEVGEFVVTFVAPNNVGELVFLNAIQTCEDGESLDWTDTDPLGAYPAARVLILEEGSPVAHSIDDIPEGTPGRELLEAGDHDHSHDDHGEEAPGDDDSAGDETDADDTDVADTTTTTVEVDDTEASASVVDEDDDDSPLMWIILGALIVAVIGIIAYLATRNRSEESDRADSENTGTGTQGDGASDNS